MGLARYLAFCVLVFAPFLPPISRALPDRGPNNAATAPPQMQAAARPGWGGRPAHEVFHDVELCWAGGRPVPAGGGRDAAAAAAASSSSEETGGVGFRAGGSAGGDDKDDEEAAAAAAAAVFYCMPSRVRPPPAARLDALV